MNSPTFVPTGAGYSVGRWEGNELVVDTIGFATNVCDFAKPHTYEFRYYRVPPASEPRTHNCLTGDEDRARFLSSGAVPAR